jgi:hypothetical protein
MQGPSDGPALFALLLDGEAGAPDGDDLAPRPDDQQELAHRGGWLQSAIAEVARQAKSRALTAVVRGPEIRQSRNSVRRLRDDVADDQAGALVSRDSRAHAPLPWFALI